MASAVATTLAWQYVAKPPDGPCKSKDIFAMRSIELPALQPGTFRARLQAISMLPHSRTFLDLPGTDLGAEDLGLKRTKLGETIPCEAVAVIVESQSRSYKVGDRIWLPFHPLAEHIVLRDDGSDNPIGQKPKKLPSFIPSETFLSMMTPSGGLTAYCAIHDFPPVAVRKPSNRIGTLAKAGPIAGLVAAVCRRQGGSPGLSLGIGAGIGAMIIWMQSRRQMEQKTVLVTSAAGTVGVVAGQLYKNLGYRVIGVTSSKEKAARLLEFGYDEGVAYKGEDLEARLREVAPKGIDLFMDNIGGEQLDIGTKLMNIGGKIVGVGCLSEVDNLASGNIRGYKQYMRLPARELTYAGFLVCNHRAAVRSAMRWMSWWLWIGRLKSVHTCVHGDFSSWADNLDKLMASSGTFGRLILINGREDNA